MLEINQLNWCRQIGGTPYHKNIELPKSSQRGKVVNSLSKPTCNYILEDIVGDISCLGFGQRPFYSHEVDCVSVKLGTYPSIIATTGISMSTKL